MHVTMKIAKGTIKDTKLEADVSGFFDGEVYIIRKEDFEILAGSESTRYQLEKAQEAITEMVTEKLALEARLTGEKVKI